MDKDASKGYYNNHTVNNIIKYIDRWMSWLKYVSSCFKRVKTLLFREGARLPKESFMLFDINLFRDVDEFTDFEDLVMIAGQEEILPSLRGRKMRDGRTEVEYRFYNYSDYAEYMEGLMEEETVEELYDLAEYESALASQERWKTIADNKKGSNPVIGIRAVVRVWPKGSAE